MKLVTVTQTLQHMPAVSYCVCVVFLCMFLSNKFSYTKSTHIQLMMSCQKHLYFKTVAFTTITCEWSVRQETLKFRSCRTIKMTTITTSLCTPQCMSTAPLQTCSSGAEQSSWVHDVEDSSFPCAAAVPINENTKHLACILPTWNSRRTHAFKTVDLLKQEFRASQ